MANWLGQAGVTAEGWNGSQINGGKTGGTRPGRQPDLPLRYPPTVCSVFILLYLAVSRS